MVELYFHSGTRLHGVMLNELSTGTTSPFTFFSSPYDDSVLQIRHTQDQLRGSMIVNNELQSMWMEATRNFRQRSRSLGPHLNR
jgi:hypothetical protein